MSRDRISQIIGTAGLTLFAVGSTLYAINSPQRTLTFVALAVGGMGLLVYLVLNLHLIRDFLARRSARYGANMIVMIVLFTAVVVIIQAVSARHSRRYDLTRNKRFTLAEQTVNILRSLPKDIDITGFYKLGTDEQLGTEDLVGQYAHESGRIRYEFIDPDRRPQLVREMGVTSYNTLVVRAGDRQEHITNVSEEKLTNAILKTTRDVIKVIYFVKGHSEKDPDVTDEPGYSIMKDAIEKEGYLVRKISLFDEKTIPDDCALLIVAGPKRDYFEAEIAKMRTHLTQGRNALFLIDAQRDLPNIAGLLEEYQIVLDNNVIIDPYSRVFGGDYTVPVVTQYDDHPITKGFDVATFFPMARSVRIADDKVDGVRATYLALTGKSAWGEIDLDMVKRGQAVRDEVDFPAPLAVAAISSKRFDRSDPDDIGFDESKIVVFGDSDFADNSAFRISGNADLILNVVNFLAEEKDLIAIRAARGLGDRLFLTASQGRLIFLLSVMLLPMSVIGVGITVFFKKRNRG
jgi:ABC-type uncharacterized transport system involved in gliding motility auxiliary subunit